MAVSAVPDILGIQIDVSAHERLMRQHRPAQVEFAIHGAAKTMFQMLRDDLAEDDLLGEILRADRDRMFLRAADDACCPQSDDHTGDNLLFDPFESSIGYHRDQRSRYRTGQQQRRIDGGQAAKNEHAESAAADRRGDRGRPDRRHGRDPQAG